MNYEVSFEEVKNKCKFIDVRSPQEFEQGSISGAINIPILDNNERAKVGMAYKQLSKNKARVLGVEIVASKLPKIVEEIITLKKENPHLVAYCARGGYRSASISSLCTSIGINVFKLENGYKGYRKFILENTPKICNEVTFVMLHGNTGVGKTEILHKLKSLGLDVLDLEGAANHRGSLLGNIGLGNCSTQRAFESDVFYQLDNIKSKYVFVEAESKQIGKIVIPDCIFSRMRNGLHIFIEADLNYRAKILKCDYMQSKDWLEESLQSLELLRRYLSNEKVDSLQSILKTGNFEEVAIELMKNYYDPMYTHKSNKYDYDYVFNAINSSAEVAKDINEWLINNFFLTKID